MDNFTESYTLSAIFTFALPDITDSLESGLFTLIHESPMGSLQLMNQSESDTNMMIFSLPGHF